MGGAEPARRPYTCVYCRRQCKPTCHELGRLGTCAIHGKILAHSSYGRPLYVCLMHRIYLDGNDGTPDTNCYCLDLNRSCEDPKIPGAPQEDMMVTIYMTGEIEMEATLEWYPSWQIWTGRPVEGTIRQNHEPTSAVAAQFDASAMHMPVDLQMGRVLRVATRCVVKIEGA